MKKLKKYQNIPRIIHSLKAEALLSTRLKPIVDSHTLRHTMACRRGKNSIQVMNQNFSKIFENPKNFEKIFFFKIDTDLRSYNQAHTRTY